jgi:hypothetical protein
MMRTVKGVVSPLFPPSWSDKKSSRASGEETEVFGGNLSLRQVEDSTKPREKLSSEFFSLGVTKVFSLQHVSDHQTKFRINYREKVAKGRTEFCTENM